MVKISVLIIGLILLCVVNLKAADYGDTDDFKKSDTYTYYVAMIEDCRIHAESWVVDGDWITFENIFKKSNCGDEVPSVSMWANPKFVISITMIRAESKKKVQSGSTCFIDSSRVW